MYESFFGFREKPFTMTPDPRFLYLSRTHREGLAQLIYGVKERKGFVVLSGEVGTGKTTIVRALLERLDQNCQVAYVFNPKLSVVEFLKYVCHDFGFEANGETKIDYMIKLHDFLIESHNEGKTTILIVDEAQNSDAAMFEE
ncbi:MAG: AAA family ATPase, partial [Proteobacteria bacterium]|nr:AAA family ATPase [Pseudomonadota bacterium]